MTRITDDQVERAMEAYLELGRGILSHPMAMRKALEAALSTLPVGAETGEPAAWLHEPTGNVFKDGECQALIKAWQKQFADTMSPEEIAADFVPLVRTSPAVPNTVGEDTGGASSVDHWQKKGHGPSLAERIAGIAKTAVLACRGEPEAGDLRSVAGFVYDKVLTDDTIASLVSQEAGE